MNMDIIRELTTNNKYIYHSSFLGVTECLQSTRSTSFSPGGGAKCSWRLHALLLVEETWWSPDERYLMRCLCLV